MYISLRDRYALTLSHCVESFEEMAPVAARLPMFRETGIDGYSFGVGVGGVGRAPHSPVLTSSASSPSLRSKESVVVRPMTPTMGANGAAGGGGNVKVVVRVRGFLPRGQRSCLTLHGGRLYR